MPTLKEETITLPSGRVLTPNMGYVALNERLQVAEGCDNGMEGMGLLANDMHWDGDPDMQAPIADKLFLAKLMMSRWMDYYVAAIDEELAKK